MVLQSASLIADFSPVLWVSFPIRSFEVDRNTARRTRNWNSYCNCRLPLGGSCGDAKRIVVKRFSNALDDREVPQEFNQLASSCTHFQQDPLVNKLRTQLGVIHLNQNIIGLFVFFFFLGVVFDKLWTRTKWNKSERLLGLWPCVPTSFSSFFEKDLQRKESVEWVNMVLVKLWMVYRAGIENWIVGLLQPVIDNLKKPDYVKRVEVKQFSLGDDPLSVRSVERKTSRRMNDLQYQIGLRYTGGARMLLMLTLNLGIVPVVVPVGVRDFDIDGELWVKLRLIQAKPWVGAVSWAFVSLPKIKFVLSPFRLFNLMAIPVVSMFLTKLLTEDLPQLFVRPKKIVLDFQKGKAVGPVADNLKSGEIQERNKDFAGELSVTLVDAHSLSYLIYGKTDPYVILSLGDQTIRSKRNSQTSFIGPPGEPTWNQDFHMLVASPQKQKLNVQVKDSLGFAEMTIGTGEIDLGTLQDTVPMDRIVVLRGGCGLFRKGNTGEVLLRLTYKAYVEDEEDDWTEADTVDPDVSEDEVSGFDEAAATYKQIQRDSVKETDKESLTDVLAALIVSEEFQRIVASETGNLEVGEDATNSASTIPTSRGPVVESTSSKRDGSDEGSKGSTLFWLTVLTCAAVLIAINSGGSSLFNP